MMLAYPDASSIVDLQATTGDLADGDLDFTIPELSVRAARLMLPA